MGWGSNNVDSHKPVYRVVVNESFDQFSSVDYHNYVTNFPNIDCYHHDQEPLKFEDWANRKISRAKSIGLCDRMWNSKATATTYSRKAKNETGIDAWVEQATISWNKL